jgi:hypothetical protein
MEDRLVYWHNERYEYCLIGAEHVQSTDTIIKFFGEKVLGELMEENDEFIIYKLVPFARISKNVEYKINIDE